jgi:hypothetical protein
VACEQCRPTEANTKDDLVDALPKLHLATNENRATTVRTGHPSQGPEVGGDEG